MERARELYITVQDGMPLSVSRAQLYIDIQHALMGMVMRAWACRASDFGEKNSSRYNQRISSGRRYIPSDRTGLVIDDEFHLVVTAPCFPAASLL